MIKAEVIAKISEKANTTKKDAEIFLNSFIETVEEAIVAGEKINLVGFMSIGVKETDARQGRNPQTKEAITIPAGKKVYVKLGKPIKDLVK